MPKVVREKEMNVPVKCLFEAITDFKSYPEFVPEVVSVEVLPGSTAEKARVKFELEVVKRFEYILEFHIKDSKEVKWKLVESNFFKTNEGAWKLKTLDKDKTHVDYELDVGFGFLVPGWVSKKLTEINLPKMLDNFEGQAKKIQGMKHGK